MTGSTPVTKTIGNRCGCSVGRKRGGTASRRDHNGYAPADDIPSQRYKSIRLTIRGTEINLHVPAFDVTGIVQRLAECRHQVRIKGLAVEKSDRWPRLLRVRSQRPTGRCTADKYDELAPSHECASR